ncbi:transglycosylase SLT domain-containing protein [Curvibacter sp. AEP1-3]|uniref:transglycosylase SLT domain-containing protein n=1 Tax=Curvibacter sp. AEP1-3 TaxID=1844971 RepID=UPI0012FAD6FE|nr:transglycosylase SLT domain-containing protein [Curvibacter sp. AEP1-3]
MSGEVATPTANAINQSVPAMVSAATTLPVASKLQHTDDMWQRLRDGFALTPLSEDTTQGRLARSALAHARWYSEHPALLARMFTRARLYMFDIVESLDQAHMPLELALLPAIESAYQTGICSRAAACGLWQFIRPTGRRFDLRQHMFVDERNHVRAATQAALRYLAELNVRFNGDWQLALAAYNWGEGNVEKAVVEARAKGLVGRFEDLKLPRETADYVPRLLGLSRLVANPSSMGITLVSMRNAPYFVPVPIERDIDMVLAARLAGLSLSEFVALNSHHKKPVVIAATGAEVYIPVENEAALREALRMQRGPMSSWTTATVNENATVDKAAATLGVPLSTFRSANDIRGKRVIVAGSTVLIPRRSGVKGQDISRLVAETAVLVTITPYKPKAKRKSVKAARATPPKSRHLQG